MNKHPKTRTGQGRFMRQYCCFLTIPSTHLQIALTLMPATDEFVGRDRNKPRAVGRIGKLSYAPPVRNIVAQESAALKIQDVDIPMVVPAEVSKCKSLTIRTKRQRGYAEPKWRRRTLAARLGFPQFQSAAMGKRCEVSAALRQQPSIR